MVRVLSAARSPLQGSEGRRGWARAGHSPGAVRTQCTVCLMPWPGPGGGGRRLTAQTHIPRGLGRQRRRRVLRGAGSSAEPGGGSLARPPCGGPLPPAPPAASRALLVPGQKTTEPQRTSAQVRGVRSQEAREGPDSGPAGTLTARLGALTAWRALRSPRAGSCALLGPRAPPGARRTPGRRSGPVRRAVRSATAWTRAACASPETAAGLEAPPGLTPR